MKSNELRIGNVTNKGVIYLFYDRGVCLKYGKSYKFSELEPMPLTEEILLKCGFEESDGAHCIWIYKGNSKYMIEWIFNEYNFRIITDRFNSTYIRQVKYVHQLQNLYFALTGEELEVIL